MEENYRAFMLALLAPCYLAPDNAFSCLQHGKIEFRRKAKLEQSDIDGIIKLRQSGLLCREIASQFGLNTATVSKIVKREEHHVQDTTLCN